METFSLFDLVKGSKEENSPVRKENVKVVGQEKEKIVVRDVREGYARIEEREEIRGIRIGTEDVKRIVRRWQERKASIQDDTLLDEAKMLWVGKLFVMAGFLLREGTQFAEAVLEKGISSLEKREIALSLINERRKYGKDGSFPFIERVWREMCKGCSGKCKVGGRLKKYYDDTFILLESIYKEIEGYLKRRLKGAVFVYASLKGDLPDVVWEDIKTMILSRVAEGCTFFYTWIKRKNRERAEAIENAVRSGKFSLVWEGEELFTTADVRFVIANRIYTRTMGKMVSLIQNKKKALERMRRGVGWSEEEVWGKDIDIDIDIKGRREVNNGEEVSKKEESNIMRFSLEDFVNGVCNVDEVRAREFCGEKFVKKIKRGKDSWVEEEILERERKKARIKIYGEIVALVERIKERDKLTKKEEKAVEYMLGLMRAVLSQERDISEINKWLMKISPVSNALKKDLFKKYPEIQEKFRAFLKGEDIDISADVDKRKEIKIKKGSRGKKKKIILVKRKI